MPTTKLSVQPPKVCSYLETVGNTPMVKLDKCLPDAAKHATILAKLEMQNPGGSLKDRIALNMVEKLEQEGKLVPGKHTIVDFTSGNTGIGYAMVAAAKGYKAIIVMPQVKPMHERYIICRQFGAQVHLFNMAHGVPAAIEYMEELAAKEDHVWVNQLFNKENPQAHVAYTGPEIWEQTNGEVDVFVHGIGTGGCIAGVGEYLKSKKASVKVCALEPTESRVHVGEAPAPHGIVGWAPGVHSSFLEGHGWEKEKLSDKARGIVDEWGHVATPDAVKMCLHVTQTEGMMIGPSSGAAIKYAFDIASRPESAGKTIVVVVPSHGIRYTTHPMWLASQTEAGVALPAGPPVMDKEAPLIAWKSEEYKPE